MIVRCIGALFLGLLPAFAWAQEKLPALRANSTAVDVRQGERLRKGEWTVDPSVPLDVYPVQRSAVPVTVTFITDVESMSFEVVPGGTVDFVVLLNGKDECRTRLVMKATSARRAQGAPSGSVTIPITIVKGKPHVQGRLNGSKPLDLLFDTGADTTVIYPSAKKRGVDLAFDGTTLNAGTGGAVTRQTSSDNRLEVGGLVWDHESVLFIEKQSDDADGIVGYNVFEDKIVELDYDRMVMVIHDEMPEYATTYTKVPMPFIGSLTAVEGALIDGTTRAVGPMVLDTGGNGALLLNRAFVDQNSLRAGLKKVGTSRSSGVGPAKISNEVFRVPTLEIAGFRMTDVPVVVPTAEDQHFVSGVATEEARGLLCMDVLGRFNTFFDYRKSEAYFKPNATFAGPFPDRTAGVHVGVVIAIASAGILIVPIAAIRLRSRGRRVPAPS